MKTVIAGNIIREKAKCEERFVGKAAIMEPVDHDQAVEAREARREQNLARRPADIDAKNHARRMAEKQAAKGKAKK